MANSQEARSQDGTLIDHGAPPSASDQSASAPASTPTPPESYEFKAPEGVSLNQELLSEATPIFKELGLSQEAAQKLVDLYSKNSGKTEAALAKTVEDMRADWRNQVMNDRELGPKIDQVKIELGRAKDKMAPAVRKSFDDAMNLTGLGDHPGIVKGLYELSKLVNEGTHVNGGGPSAAGQSRDGAVSKPSIAGALYPNLTQ